MIRRTLSVLAPAALALAALLMITGSASAYWGWGFGYRPYYGRFYRPYYGGFYGGLYRPYYGGYGYGAWNSPYYLGYSNYYYTPSWYYPGATTYYYTPSYTPSSYYSAPIRSSNYSYGAVASDGITGVHITVKVPANALVWFDGEKTTQTGSMRTFASPPLDSKRNLSYTIRAKWMEGNRTVERTKKVAVHNGDRFTVDFTPQ